MFSLRNFAKLVASLLFLISLNSMAHGQAAAFVSSAGNDLNTPCARATPCRNLQAAVDAVAANGQVTVLDSAGYGSLVIAKSVIINAYPGVIAAINATSGTAITITSGSVTISGLKINGNGSAATGISLVGATAVVENCEITGFTGAGISVGNNSAVSRMDLINTNLFRNGTGVISDGEGANIPGNMLHASTSMVRINGGNITTNGVGLHQKHQGDPNFRNIAVFNPGNVPLVNVVANTTADLQCSLTVNCSNQPLTFSFNSQPWGP